MDDQYQGPHPIARRRRPRWLIVAVVVTALAVLAVVLYIPVYATSASTYCGSCHEMDEAHASWEDSSHSGIQCIECHIPPGGAAAVKWRAKELRNIWASYLHMAPAEGREPRPSNANCIKCHPLDGLMGVPGVVRMPHATHINRNNLNCIDCHDDIAHPRSGKSSEVSMRPCTMCHEQTSDPARCSFCHYDVPQGEAHPTDFLREHGTLAAQGDADCLRCHHDRAGFCDSCHAKPPQGHYTGDWRNDHGKEAVKDRALCTGCHSWEALCKQCHEVNHPDEWVETHGPLAARGTESCLVCHPSLMCEDCHSAEEIQAP
jgi:nitrate/TMAO reductase-like tetraheme cytochrome c subunit